MMKKGLISAPTYIYLYPLGALTLVFLISWFLVIPLSRQAYQRYIGLADKRERLAILKEKKQTLETIDEQTLETLRELTLALPDDKDPASIMVSLDNLSGQSNLFIENLEFSPLTVAEATSSQSPTQSKSSRLANTVELSINSRGTTQNFHDFVSQLLGSRRLMDIDEIDIKLQPESGDLMKVAMKLIAYYLPPLTQIGQVESRLSALTAEEKQILSTIGNLPYISSQQVVVDEGSAGGSIGKTDLFAP